MELIRLPKGEWHYDPATRLGSAGGFGAVFGGESQTFGPIAVKKLYLEADEVAHREMRIASDLIGRQLTNVMPVLDAGEDAESGRYFVVMPRAERSLQDELDDSKRFEDVDAAKILGEVANGLSEVRDIVHRDLKPGNVLFHEGRWKVADFGIARFVEESTSLKTLKECLSPPYAAPEQWQLRRANQATDVYALGCVGYALLTGNPPFSGPTADDYRGQHLRSDPPQLVNHLPLLRSLLSMALRKVPEARPSLTRVKRQLSKISEANNNGGSEGLHALERAGAAVAEEQARQERVRLEEEQRLNERLQLFSQGQEILRQLVEELFGRIVSAAPMAERSKDRWCVILGQGSIQVVQPSQSPGFLPLEADFLSAGWDVISLDGRIGVTQSHPKPYVWSSSLWYARPRTKREYRWYEVSYFRSAEYRKAPTDEPFGLGTDQLGAAVSALGPGLHPTRLAFGPLPIDDEDLDEFCDRWEKLLAKASDGTLRHPGHFPLKQDFADSV